MSRWSDYHLVFMHGRTTFRLTDAERQRLKQYVERAGCCGRFDLRQPGLSESFRREMAAIFPDRKIERIPAGDPLLSTTYGGFDCGIVSRRDPEAVPRGSGPLEASTKKFRPTWRH